MSAANTLARHYSSIVFHFDFIIYFLCFWKDCKRQDVSNEQEIECRCHDVM